MEGGIFSGEGWKMSTGIRWTEAELYEHRLKTAKAAPNHRPAIQAPHVECPIRDESVGASAIDQLDKKFRIHFHSRRRRLADPDGISAKAAIDGLREGGLLVDDSPKYVKGVSFSQENSKAEAEETVIEIWEELEKVKEVLR